MNGSSVSESDFSMLMMANMFMYKYFCYVGSQNFFIILCFNNKKL